MQTMSDIINIKKCIFDAPFDIFLGHVLCKHDLLVDPTKIVVVVNLPPKNSVCQLKSTLGHTGYYRNFIRGYAQIIVPMEKFQKKHSKHQWNEECQQSLDILKEKMVTASI
jgi:hypothetical protein